MTLQGTLTDLASVQLVQFPHNGRKTGELFVSNPMEEAHFFYHDGNLIHAEMGSKIGIDVLIDVLGWTEGKFEFRTGVRSNQRSIDQDLHQVLMIALVAKDERDQGKNEIKENPTPEKMKGRIESILDSFLISYSSAVCIYILDRDAMVMFRSQASKSQENLNKMQKALFAFIRSYPNDLTRAFIESEEGMFSVFRLSKYRYLVLFTLPEASLGMVTVKVNKLIDSLNEILGLVE